MRRAAMRCVPDGSEETAAETCRIEPVNHLQSYLIDELREKAMELSNFIPIFHPSPLLLQFLFIILTELYTFFKNSTYYTIKLKMKYIIKLLNVQFDNINYFYIIILISIKDVYAYI